MNRLQKENSDQFKYMYREREVLYKQLESIIIDRETQVKLNNRISELTKQISINIANGKLGGIQ